MGPPSDKVTKTSARLFTGASWASRGFELAVVVAAVAAATHALALASSEAPGPFLTGLPSDLAAAVAVALIALAGVFPLPLGHKVHMSLGSGAAFAVLLIFPLYEALPVAFTGILIAQVVRRYRGDRLSLSTILFNQMQYVVTWSLAVTIYLRTRSDLSAHPALSWIPVVAAGAVYLLVNTWIVTTWTALRKRTWAWDLWVHGLHESGLGYAVSLFLGAVVASLAAVHSLLAVPLVVAVAVMQWMLSHVSRVHLRQVSAALAALVEGAEHGSPYTVEHSERVSWWAERLARHLGRPQSEIEAIAIAGKLHDLGQIILRGDLEEKAGPLSPEAWTVVRQHPAVGADIIRRLPGLATVARYVRYHHERYDGAGYPEGLEGEAIPLGARIIMVAESYDAMLGVRPHRPALDQSAALAEIAAGAGGPFDPRVAAALLALARAEARDGAEGPTRRRYALAFAASGGTTAAGAPGRGSLLRELRAGAAGDTAPVWRPAEAAWQAPPPALAHQLMAAQEAERHRLARELHDEIGQALTGLKFMLETFSNLPAHKAGESLREAQTLIAELMTRVHDLSLDLRPAMLDDLGLLPALRWQFERYTARTGVQVACAHSGVERRFPAAVETAAYRIVQEALTNVARHAGVDHVAVRLAADQRMLQVEIEDRGAGFAPHELGAAGTTGGLAGMRERALLLGGRLVVTAARGTGTRITADLPLDLPAAAPQSLWT